MQHTIHTFLIRHSFHFASQKPGFTPPPFSHASNLLRIQKCLYIWTQLLAPSSIFLVFPLSLSYSLHWVCLFCFLFLCVWGKMSGKRKICLSFQMLQFICSLMHIHIFSVLQPSYLSALAEHCHKQLYSSDIPATTILSWRWPGPCSVSLTWWGNCLYQFLSPDWPWMGRCMLHGCLLIGQKQTLSNASLCNLPLLLMCITIKCKRHH